MNDLMHLFDLKKGIENKSQTTEAATLKQKSNFSIARDSFKLNQTCCAFPKRRLQQASSRNSHGKYGGSLLIETLIFSFSPLETVTFPFGCFFVFYS